MSTDTPTPDLSNLAPGTIVTYDGRANGEQSGVIEHREAIASYYPGNPDLIYYAIEGAGVLIPAADILTARTA